MAALMRNISTSAWVTDTTLTLPFWPSSEVAKLGPKLTSSYDGWGAESTTLMSGYDCQEMKLESAEMSEEPYSDVWDVMVRYPRKGTQPMVTFVLSSTQGCTYELMMHPIVDLAYNGGITWSNATTFFPQQHTLPLGVGTHPIAPNVTSTHVYARLNASKQCNGHDIIIMNTPWTAPIDYTPFKTSPWIPENMTYERSADFRMQGMLCQSHYSMSRDNINAFLADSVGNNINASAQGHQNIQDLPESLLDIVQVQRKTMTDEWRTYFDRETMRLDALQAAGPDLAPPWAARFPGYSGLAPMLAVLSDFDLVSLMNDRNIVKTAARVKGRFFTEMIRETLNSPDLFQTNTVVGTATVVQERVVVLVEIGFALAALFFASTVLLVAIYWTSRLSHRPLKLSSDPSSIVGLSLLLQPHLVKNATFRKMHNESREDLYKSLRKESYLTSDMYLIQGSAQPAIVKSPIKIKRDWRPRVIRTRMLLALGALLTSIVTAILTLNAFSLRSQLSQTGFIYEADISKLKLSFPTFAPISIAPTVASIAIGLWWDQLDMTFRILQPYVSMSRGPTPINAGAGLTYTSKTWAGAAFKAARYKHWILFLVTVGSVLAQVLTVSMSALFEKASTNVTQQMTAQQSLEIRHEPLVSEIELTFRHGIQYTPSLVLNELYLNPRKNWLFGAGIKHSFNGSELPWTLGGWNFLPVDLAQFSTSRDPQHSPDFSENRVFASTNVSLEVPAIKARLDCKPVEEVAETSSWLEIANFTGSRSITKNDIARLNSTGGFELYQLSGNMFQNSSSQTTILADATAISCCSNGTMEQPRRNAIGYWSVATPNNESFPFTSASWPLSFVTKWIVGEGITVQYRNEEHYLYFREKPKMQAARCQPVIETTEATVSVDAHSGAVHSYEIKKPVSPIDFAWAEVFVKHQLMNASLGPLDDLYEGPMNVTTSFGVVFLLSMLRSLMRDPIFGMPKERLDENAFVFRDPELGTNMDLMTNTMYSLVGSDPEVLLDYRTLADTADRTFQSFFQEFVNSDLSLKNGGYAYQPVGDQSMRNIGRPVNENGTIISRRAIPDPNPYRNITASVSNRIRLLHMNTVATYISTAILVWLIATTFIIISVQRKYTSLMMRDVKLIADMLVLVAGSDKFLELVQEQGVALKKDKQIQTKLGWFKDRDGEVRWGIEVVGGEDAVEWVEAPKIVLYD
ncbi:hypothetical protein GGP41_003090 [Bipolaris sorokiniana]|uniref:Uncharacterized protein n=1 Tax=Cochliobolus sativus TaxID=45130 RepID=A0A8H5ZCH0_COCSA|nr:hypothetical protein GGP41_003090 [Bipolaris sorokiniana]